MNFRHLQKVAKDIDDIPIPGFESNMFSPGVIADQNAALSKAIGVDPDDAEFTIKHPYMSQLALTAPLAAAGSLAGGQWKDHPTIGSVGGALAGMTSADIIGALMRRSKNKALRRTLKNQTRVVDGGEKAASVNPYVIGGGALVGGLAATGAVGIPLAMTEAANHKKRRLASALKSLGLTAAYGGAVGGGLAYGGSKIVEAINTPEFQKKVNDWMDNMVKEKQQRMGAAH